MATVEMDVAPWERQFGETAPAFEAFETYRDMGYERSTAKVQRAIGKSKRLIDGWSSTWGWVERCVHWDREQDRLRQARRQVKLAEAEDRLDALADGVLGQFANWLRALTPEKVEKMSAGQAVAMFDRAAKVQLLVLGGSTENVHHDGAVDVSGSISMAKRVIDDPDAAEAALSALDRISAAG